MTKLRLSLDISTTHRGDLYITLQAPEGGRSFINIEEGADGQNLVEDYNFTGSINSDDVTGPLSDIEPHGTWTVAIQDRLKGDLATFNSAVLEIAADEPVVTTPPVTPPVTPP
jgi:subtilisin-like proprotein convertase family protein